jgi:hypothetical protein
MAYQKVELAAFPKREERPDIVKNTKQYTNKISKLSQQEIKDKAIEEASNNGKCWWVKAFLKA